MIKPRERASVSAFAIAVASSGNLRTGSLPLADILKILAQSSAASWALCSASHCSGSTTSAISSGKHHGFGGRRKATGLVGVVPAGVDEKLSFERNEADDYRFTLAVRSKLTNFDFFRRRFAGVAMEAIANVVPSVGPQESPSSAPALYAPGQQNVHTQLWTAAR